MNTAIFNVDWADLPAFIVNDAAACPGGFGTTNNIGEANSKGIEVETNYLITPQLAINLSASYIEAEWKKTEGITAEPGESLSFAPRTNANLGVQYGFDVSSYPAFVRADVNYVGEYETQFKSSGFGTAGDYVNVNMRLGLDIDQWSLAFYVVNLTDESSLIHSGPSNEYIVRPRKVGLEANYAF